MHEAAIAQSLIDEIEELRERGAITGEVKTICLRIGRLTAVIPESLRFAFGVLSQGTALAGATLAIEDVPVRGLCRACGAGAEIHELCFLCAACGSSDLEIQSGRELLIEAVEVE